MSITTQALVAPKANGSLKIQDIHLDDLRPNEALVEIHAVGICHADISCLNGTIPVKFPCVFGHEGAGKILQIGSAIRNIIPGDKVILSYNACYDCPTCLSGCPAYCHHMLKLNFGGTRLDDSYTMRTSDGSPISGNFFGQSSFSKTAIVSKSSIVKVPPNTPLQLLAPLGCGLQTGAGAIFNILNLSKGSSVVVFGTGAVGMAAIMAAKIRRVDIIIAIDILQNRLATARTLGATHAMEFNGSDSILQIRTICGGVGAMCAIDTTGNITVIEEMMECLGPKGKGITIGAPSPGQKVKVDVFRHITLGRQYIGCNQGDSVPQEMIPILIEQYFNGNFPVEKIVKIYDFADFESALKDIKSGRTIKPVLIWPEASHL